MEGHPRPHCPPNALLGNAPAPEVMPTCYGFDPEEAQGDGSHHVQHRPGDSPPFLGDAGTHPATSTSQKQGSQRRGRLGTLPPARFPGRDA